MSLIIRIPNWGDLQHYKTRAAPWIKRYRRELAAGHPDGQKYLSLDLATRGLLDGLKLLAVEFGNAIPLSQKVLAEKLATPERLGPKLGTLLDMGLIELAESPLAPPISGQTLATVADTLARSIQYGTSSKGNASTGRGMEHVASVVTRLTA